jgi:hypothetical protein
MRLAVEPAATRPLPPPGGHVLYEGASDRPVLLVVFAFVDQPVGTRSHSSFLRDVECKKLFLNPGVNAWYQTGVPGAAADWDGLRRYLADVKAEHPRHEILCLGHSMGGYAALGMGLAIGADRILASVPEYRLNLPASISVRHLGATPLACPDLAPALAANRDTAVTVIYGRENAFDASMATGIAALTPTTLVPLPCGHGTSPWLKERGCLADTLAAFVDGRPLPIPPPPD